MQLIGLLLFSGFLTSQVLTLSSFNKVKEENPAYCPPAPEELVISSTEEAKRYSNCLEFAGSVTITSSDNETIIDWPSLKKIKGDFKISGRNISEIYLPSLIDIKGVLTFEHLSNLRNLSISSLGDVEALILEDLSLKSVLIFSGVSVNKRLSIKNTHFQSIQGIRVKSFDFDIEISGNPNLEAIGLRFNNNQINNINVQDNALLKVLDFPFIQRIQDSLIVKNNKALVYFKINHLSTVVNRVEIISPKLTNLEFGSFVMRNDDIIEAPLDCNEFKKIHAEFDIVKCEQLVRESSVVSTTYSLIVLLASIAVAFFLF